MLIKHIVDPGTENCLWQHQYGEQQACLAPVYWSVGKTARGPWRFYCEDHGPLTEDMTEFWAPWFCSDWWYEGK